MRNNNFEINNNAIQYRFSKEDFERLNIGKEVITSSKIYMKKNNDKIEIMLCILPNVKSYHSGGFQDIVKRIVVASSDEITSKLFNTSSKTNEFVYYMIFKIINDRKTNLIINKLFTDLSLYLLEKEMITNE